MSENWMPVEKAVREGLLEVPVVLVNPSSTLGFMTKRFLPVKLGERQEGAITIIGDSTWVEDQKFSREDLGNWFLTGFSGKVYAFPEKATSRLVLSGVRGLKDGSRFLREVSVLYEDRLFGEMPVPMPVEMWKTLPKRYQGESHWFEKPFENGFESGLLIARNGEIEEGILCRRGNTVLNAYGVRPVIPLKKGIEVDLDSNPNSLTLRNPEL